MSLTGTAQGATRADIITQAEEMAATYYGTKCVSAVLFDEATNRDEIWGGGPEPIRAIIGFTASWTADIDHRYNQVTYGHPKCHKCGKEKR